MLYMYRRTCETTSARWGWTDIENVQVLKEKLQAKYLSQGCKGIVNVCFSCREYEDDIEKQNGTNVTGNSEVEVPDNGTRYMKRVFAPENFYGTGKTRFESVMLQSGT